jgi:hypothetical protein
LQAVFQNEATTTTTMKFSIALFALISAVPTAVQAAPIETCSDQAGCLFFTVTPVASTTPTCATGDCEFKVCMTLNLTDIRCGKSGSVSHTCEKASDECFEDGGGFSAADTKGSIVDGYSSCQIVPAGGIAEFLMKDGGGGCDSDPNDPVTSGGATCRALEDVYPTGGSCSGNVDMECIWTVTAPLCDTPSDTDTLSTAEDVTAAEEALYLCE